MRRFFRWITALLGLAIFSVPPCGCDKVQPSKNNAASTPSAKGDRVEFEDGAVTVTSEDNGAKLTLGGNSTKAPDHWPKDIPFYPGASITLAFERGEAGKGSAVVMLASADPAEAIVKFYTSKALSAGYLLSSDTRSPDSWNQSFVTATQSFNLAVKAGKAGTDISLQVLEGQANIPPATPRVFWSGVDALPPQWPADVIPLPPGAEITAVGLQPEENGSVKYRAQFLSSQGTADVLKFYTLKAPLSGFSPAGASASGVAVFSGQRGQMDVACFAQEGRTAAVLTFVTVSKTVEQDAS